MDNKRLVVFLLISAVLVTGWALLQNYLRARYPHWYERQQQTQVTQEPTPATQPSTTPDATVEQTTGAPADTSAAPSGNFRVVGGQTQAVRLGRTEFDPERNDVYPIGLSIEPYGASLQSVTLNRFREQVEQPEPYVFQQPYEIGTKPSRSLATNAIVLDGTPVPLNTVAWRLVEQTETSATYAVDVYPAAAQQPITIFKTFQIFPATHPTAGYEVAMEYRIENKTGQAFSAELIQGGPNIPPVETSRDAPAAVVGHNDEGRVLLTHTAGTSFTPEQGTTSILAADKGPFLWSGFVTAYFNAIIRPAGQTSAIPIQDVTVDAVAPYDTDTGREYLTMTLQTGAIQLAPGATTSLPFEVYLGPRWRDVLKNPYYAAFPRSYDQTLVLISGWCGICTFQWLINALVAMLSVFHMLFRDWGLAIIALVLVVRLVLHPVTKRSQISMSKMSKMGPEMERLKKKYGDNKEELNRAMMSLYKEQGATPILGCLPMLLQMPIWIALWQSLQSTFELRQAPFLWGWTWINDLAQPDHLITFGRTFKFLFLHIDGLNLLPILMAGVFYLQQYFQPKPAASTPEQAQQQKMMQWMVLLFPVMLYTAPAGLNLYILTSTAIGIWESKRVRDHINAIEEREKEGKVIVDVRPGRASKRRSGGAATAERTGLAGWLANLQDKAEEMRDQRRKPPKK